MESSALAKTIVIKGIEAAETKHKPNACILFNNFSHKMHDSVRV